MNKIYSFLNTLVSLFICQIFLPSDDTWTWILAKMWFTNSDTLVHEADHLGM